MTMPIRGWTPAEVARLEKLAIGGVSDAKIGAVIGRSAQAVMSCRKDIGIGFGGQLLPIYAAREALRNRSIEEVSAETGYDRSRLRRMASLLGLIPSVPVAERFEHATPARPRLYTGEELDWARGHLLASAEARLIIAMSERMTREQWQVMMGRLAASLGAEVAA